MVMASKHIITVTSPDVWQNEVLNSDQPVLVDFWATWCGPCRAIAPMVDQLADEYAGKARVAKLDVDAHQNIAAQFGISSIPTLIVFKGGHVVDQVLGARPKPALAALIDKHL
jgi:thioredoxin